MKKITVEKVVLFLAAAFAAYNFGLAGGYIEGAQFSIGGLVAGVVVNVSLAIAASRYGSLKGDKRTRQATAAFVTMMVFSPVLVSPVVFYSLPETFLSIPLRWAWAIAWPMTADLAIVLAGAVSGKGLIALSEPAAAQSATSADEGAPSADAVRTHKKRSADAVRQECAALSAQYACTEAQCGWSPSVDALVASAQAGRSARSAAASAKAGHVKAKHPKVLTAAEAGWPGTTEKPA